MTWTDGLTVLVAAGAIVATVATGQCSTKARFSDVNARIDDVTRRMDAEGGREQVNFDLDAALEAGPPTRRALHSARV